MQWRPGELGAGNRLVFGVRRPWGRRVSTVRPRRLGAAEYREGSTKREITREATPRAGRPTPLAPEETSSDQNVRLSSPWSNVDRSLSGHDKAEREKTFAWLLLLLKERRGARQRPVVRPFCCSSFDEATAPATSRFGGPAASASGPSRPAPRTRSLPASSTFSRVPSSGATSKTRLPGA
jgi:hypothetical protein